MKPLSRQRAHAILTVNGYRIPWLTAIAGICIISAAASAGEVHLDAELEPAEIPFHRVMEYTIILEKPTDLELDPPNLRDHFGDLPVHKGPIRRTRTLSPDRVRIKETYVLSPLEPSEYPIDPVTVTWNENRQAATPEFLAVARELTPEEREAVARFMPNAGLATMPPALHERWEFWAALVGLTLATVLLALIMRHRRRTGGEAPGTPWERALARLDALQTEGLPATGKAYAYYGELSQILRDYIEQRFHLHAPERTTPEFLNEAALSGVLSTEQQRFLERFLRHSDRVKFAQLQPGLKDMEQHMHEVRRFVTETAADPDTLTQDAA